MELTKCIQVLEQCVGYPIQAHEDQGVYQWIHAKQQFHFFQKNQQLCWEGSIGSPLADDSKSRELLNKILQFNLKRMRFIEGTLLLDPTTHQLYLRYGLPIKECSAKNLTDKFTDFLLNLETIEEQFFPDFRK